MKRKGNLFSLSGNVRWRRYNKFDIKAEVKVVYNYVNNQTCVFNQSIEQSTLDKFFRALQRARLFS